MQEINVFILIDENGDFVMHQEETELGGKYIEDIDGDAALCRRVVQIKLNVPLPKPICVPTIDVPKDKLTVEVK